jgi:heme/copper-type cytochrome/quinol oxidase subunit 2
VTRPLRALLLTIVAVLPLAAATVWTTGALSRMAAPPDDDGGAGPRDIPVRVHAWGFSPSLVRVKPGQRVRFVVVSDDIKHGFAINELRLNLQLLPGQEVRSPMLEVTLPEGTYAIHCSTFCGLGHPSMKAKLVVGTPGPEPAAAAPWVASALAAAAVAGVALVARSRKERHP